MSGFGGLGQLFSNVDIKILQYTVAGRRVDVPENADPFMMNGDTYRNSWLGFSIQKPSSFKFTDFDVAWPQTAVVAMEGPKGQSLKVENLSASLPASEIDAAKILADKGIRGARDVVAVSGRKAIVEGSGENAGAVVADRGNVWVVTTSGPQAKELLERAISTVAFSY